MAWVKDSSRNTALTTAITRSAHISRWSIDGEFLSSAEPRSHLAQHRRTIHVVMAAMRAMAVMVISVFNIIVIAVLILC